MNRALSALPAKYGVSGALLKTPVGRALLALAIRTFAGLAVLILPSCGVLARHHFALPGKGWRARDGQLMYRNGNVTVVGDVLVRFSKTGDFEMTFSKGPGITLFSIQQDATFAQVKSAFAHLSWSGRTEDAPAQLRSWLSLRQLLLAAPDQRVVRHTVGAEKFVFRF